MTSLPDDIRELVDRCLAGEQAAMGALVDHFAGQVFGLCYRMLGNRQDAEDVTQETFVRVFRSLAQFDRDRDFRPWLLAIAGNRCRSWLTSRRRVPLPTDLVDLWNKALRAAVAKPDVQKRFLENGMDTVIGSPAELKATIVADRKKWSEVIQAAGMRAD